jgi:hypothetical protein
MELSSVSPELYARRMLEFILRHTDYHEIMEARAKKGGPGGSKNSGAAFDARKNLL